MTSLSRAMFLGLLRDRTALFFTVLFPLMFLLLFGGLFKDQTAPRSDVLQIGSVAVLDQIPSADRADLDAVLHIEKATSRDDALHKVRKGDVDAAVEQSGSTLILHYSAADRVKSATVQGVFNALVQSGNLAAAEIGRAHV